MQLAESLWPRTGGGASNRALLPVAGPDRGEVSWRCELSKDSDERALRFCGIALAEDTTLRVVSGGALQAVEVGRGVLWRDSEPCFAPPVALRGSATLALCQRRLRTLDPLGRPLEEIPFEMSPDDSNVAPNLSSGMLLLSTPTGSLYRHEWGRFIRLGSFGYDILPPAVFEDGTLAVSGYGGSGYCRVALDGSSLWRTGQREVDLLPAIAKDQRSAVGALNEGRSYLYDPDGQLLGIFPEAALLSEHPLGWVARSEQAVSLLRPDGQIVWRKELRCERSWGGLQAIVDARGAVYAPCEEGLCCLDPEGHVRFVVGLQGAPDAVAPLREGHMLALSGGALSAIG